MLLWCLRISEVGAPFTDFPVDVQLKVKKYDRKYCTWDVWDSFSQKYEATHNAWGRPRTESSQQSLQNFRNINDGMLHLKFDLTVKGETAKKLKKDSLPKQILQQGWLCESFFFF